MLPFPIDAHPPLHGVRVLDAARVLAGPFCGQLLADLGAGRGEARTPRDRRRHPRLGPAPITATSKTSPRTTCRAIAGKRSLTLDIAKPDGSAVFQKTARESRTC